MSFHRGWKNLSTALAKGEYAYELNIELNIDMGIYHPNILSRTIRKSYADMHILPISRPSSTVKDYAEWLIGYL